MADAKVCILQRNVEGLTQAKRDVIQQIAKTNTINIILLQETHTEQEEELIIDGFDLICFTPHKKHGTASYTKEDTLASLLEKSPETSLIQWSCH